MLSSHRNRIQSRIIPLGFLPVFLINSSWLYSPKLTLPSRGFKRIPLYCRHKCYLEEILCPALSSHLRKCLSINLRRDVTGILCFSKTGRYPVEECVGGGPCFRLQCTKALSLSTAIIIPITCWFLSLHVVDFVWTFDTLLTYFIEIVEDNRHQANINHSE